MPTLKDYENTDELHNPSSEQARRLNDLEDQTGKDAGVNAGIDQAESFANDPANNSKNIDDTRERENQFGYQPKLNSSPKNKLSTSQRLLKFAKGRRGATAGIFGGLGIVGFLISSLFSGMTMLINVQSNAVDQNDVRSVTLDRRLASWLDKKLGNGRGSPCDVTKYACRMGKMPNKMLSRMSEQGIKPLDANGNEIKIDSESGYVDENPSKYEVADPSKPDGKRIINSSDIPREYRKNPVFRSTFKKAYNMRYRAWVGKNISKIFYSRFNLRSDGGMAAKDNKLTPDNVDEELNKRLDSTATKEASSDRKKLFRDYFEKILDKTAKKATTGAKGEPSLLLGTAYCAAVNVPGFVAGAYRSIQLAQILLLAQDVILSPAGKIKAGDASPDEVSAIGNKLTETVNGKSAMDSAILLSAIGANKGKTKPSKLAPGYGPYSSAFVQGAGSVSVASKGFCNKVTSPQALVAASGIDGAITASTGGAGGIIIGILKGIIIAGVALGAVDATLSALEHFGITGKIADLAYNLTANFVGDYTEGARGEKLGDALGVGLFAYFSTSGLSSGAGVLKKDQLVAFNKEVQSVDNDYRQEAIATLNPLDTTSKYTFLGSLMSNLSMISLHSSNLGSSLTSVGSLVMNPLGSILSPSASALGTDNTAIEAKCDHGDMFDIQDDIAINPAGYPCVGIPAEYMGMSVDEVYNTVSYDVDENTGEWKTDGDIAGIQNDCQDADLTAVGGCTITDKKRAAQSIYQFDKEVSDILDGSDDNPVTPTAPTGNGTSFRIASFNMRGASHTDGPNRNEPTTPVSTWSARVKHSIDVAKSKNLEIIGFQEFEPVQRNAMKNALTNWGMTKEGKNSDAIMWNKDRFSLEDEGTWLTTYFGGNTDEPWIRLKDKGSGQVFFVMNAHDPINRGQGNNEARYQNALAHAAQIKKLHPEAPVLLTGDFNSSYSNDAGAGAATDDKLTYCVLTSSGLVNDAYDLSVPRPAKCPNKPKSDPNFIDHIYLTPEIQLTAFDYVRGGYTSNGSDHPTIFSDVVIPGAGSAGDSSKPSDVVGDDYAKECGNFLSAGDCTGECVGFVKFRLVKHGVINPIGLGSGGQVTSTLRGQGFKVDTIPAVHSVMSLRHNSVGHTAMVSAVNKDGSIVVEEYNWTHSHAYDKRTIDKATLDRYIHSGILDFAHTETKYK